MFKEFRDFVARGNIVDIAVGLVLAVAFGALVTSLVENVLTPIVAAIFGQPDFSSLTISLWNDAVITYGVFLNAVFSFLAVGAAIFFFVVKPYNALRERMAEADDDADEAPPTPEDIALLREIRDALSR